MRDVRRTDADDLRDGPMDAVCRRKPFVRNDMRLVTRLNFLPDSYTYADRCDNDQMDRRHPPVINHETKRVVDAIGDRPQYLGRAHKAVAGGRRFDAIDPRPIS